MGEIMSDSNNMQKLFRALAADQKDAGRWLPESAARDMEKLVSLFVVDRVTYPQVYVDSRIREKIHISEIIGRNAALVSAFAPFFEGAKSNWEQYKRQAVQINECLDRFGREELLHIPGQVHEAILANPAFSAENRPGRKKLGSYYTPSYIVRHMVKQSFNCFFGRQGVARLPKGFKALDPACGGASFLLEVWDMLTKYGLSEIEALEAVFGTDIDNEAVKLSIFVLTAAVLAKTGKSVNPGEIKGRWEKQVKHGNALSVLSLESLFPGTGLPGFINWQEAFPGVFAEGPPVNQRGFDFIVGNPPYVANKLIPLQDKKYYREKYLSAEGQFDLSVPFIEQGINLLKNGGILCYITSNKFLAADYGKTLRKELLERLRISDLTDVSTLKAFAGTAAYPVIITVCKKTPAEVKCPVSIFTVDNWEDLAEADPVIVDQGFFRTHGDYLITTKLDNRILPVINKLNGISGRIPQGSIRCGLALTGFNQWTVKNSAMAEVPGPGQCFRPFIQAGHIKPYRIEQHDWIDTSRFNSAKWLRLKGPKLVVPGIAMTLKAAVDYSDCLLGRVYFIRETDTEYDLRYLVVLLNSLVLNFYYSVMYWSVHLAGEYLRFNSGYLANLPVCPLPDKPDSIEGRMVSEIVGIGHQLNGGLTCQELDDLYCLAESRVFSLYGLTPEEAEIIMGFLGLQTGKRDKIKRLMKEV